MENSTFAKFEPIQFTLYSHYKMVFVDDITTNGNTIDDDVEVFQIRVIAEPTPDSIRICFKDNSVRELTSSDLEWWAFAKVES